MNIKAMRIELILSLLLNPIRLFFLKDNEIDVLASYHKYSTK